MNVTRILGIFLRHFLVMIRDFNRFLTIFFWPMLDITIWGYVSIWMDTKNQSNQLDLSMTMLSAIVFWIVIYLTSQDVPRAVLEELWSNNFVNIFSTPLKLYEWIIAILLLSIISISITLSFVLIMIKLIYGINLLLLGLLFPFFLISLLLSGWSLGFFAGGSIVYFGRKIEHLTWMIGWIFAPFSGVFFPVKILPIWMQKISVLLPMTYIFENMRNFISKDKIDFKMISVGLGLSIFYFIITWLYFVFMFNKSKTLGLSRLE